MKGVRRGGEIQYKLSIEKRVSSTPPSPLMYHRRGGQGGEDKIQNNPKVLFVKHILGFC